jgi:hypothetical protein
MDKYIRLHSNMRFNALFLMAAVAIILIVSESDSGMVLLGSKAAGFAIAYLTYILGRKWRREGKLKEMDELINARP